LLAIVALGGCDTLSTMMASGPTATAKLEPTKGNKANGTATFTQDGSKVRLVANITGLNPGQQHGFHVHEAGDCSSGDGMSTKGHFNPASKPHAHFSTPERHTGDMPALQADADGNAKLDTTLDLMTIEPGPNSIVGRGLIVHAAPDDYKTQPTGNAGARIACAVIQRS
jgi:Cu-Zn family superoxide dismutase